MKTKETKVGTTRERRTLEGGVGAGRRRLRQGRKSYNCYSEKVESGLYDFSPGKQLLIPLLPNEATERSVAERRVSVGNQSNRWATVGLGGRDAGCA